MAEGLVIKAVGNLYKIKTADGKYIDCRIKGRLRTLDIKSTNPVTVGDHIEYEMDSRTDVGGITEIKDRKNYIVRKSTNLSRQSHVLAANLDQAVLIVTLKEPETNTDFIDRYLAAAESFSIPVVLVFNKIDLLAEADHEKLKELTAIYRDIGYQCLHISVKENKNVDKFKQLINNKITVIGGNSGVGKSSLIKAIDPELDIKIGNISEYHKAGMHTTSFSEMFELHAGGFLIDTPGIRGFGLYDFQKEELSHYFPEIFNESSKCKFYNCMHIHEPGCAVLEAVKNGEIAYSRYSSYYNLFNDENAKYR